MNDRAEPNPKTNTEAADGVLLVDKPWGVTSHDVVECLRARLRIRKVGHGGTLDPSCTGLLVILIGRGTKLSDRFLSSDKTYEGAMRLGIATDSHDVEGRTVAVRDWRGVTREKLEEAMKKFQGDVLQTPPMVSAVKVDGVPLYRRARKGEIVERKPRLIHVYEFKLLGFQPPEAEFSVRCTKGTYVRTLCADLGETLECGAYLMRLRRTRSGTMRVEDSVPLDELMLMDRAKVLRKVIPMAEVLCRLG